VVNLQSIDTSRISVCGARRELLDPICDIFHLPQACVELVKGTLEGFVVGDVILLHDDGGLATAVGDRAGDPSALAPYFGAEVGFYFAWLHYYTQ
jgi:hypothetical protein